MGAVDEKDKEISEDITYINEINNQDSSFQIHFYGSELIIGNQSGMTHLASVVSTPLLVIDSPWPLFYPTPKEREYRIVMRKLDEKIAVYLTILNMIQWSIIKWLVIYHMYSRRGVLDISIFGQ